MIQTRSATHAVNLSSKKIENRLTNSTRRSTTPTSKLHLVLKVSHGHRTLSASHAKRAYVSELKQFKTS